MRFARGRSGRKAQVRGRQIQVDKLAYGGAKPETGRRSLHASLGIHNDRELTDEEDAP
jgi:hypothetical protein